MQTSRIALVALGLTAVYVLSPAQTPQPSKQPGEPQLISSLKGPDLYQAYCAVCHGRSAKGDGPMAITLRATPSDLTRLATRNRGRFPKQHVEGILLGEVDINTHGTKEMPLWGPVFSQVAWDQDLGRVRIDNVTKYIETLQAK
jgi:mono/diheme cytochrome c family protein